METSLNLAQVLTNVDPEPDYIVKHLLYQDKIIVIAGEPGAGKSFFTQTLSMCVAADLPFLGKETMRGGSVLYFDEENSQADLRQYLRWAWRGLGCPSVEQLQDRLHIEHFRIIGQGSKRYEYMMGIASRVKPCLIVIDTATPICAIVKEDDNAEASRAVQRLRLIKEAAGSNATMVIIKHALLTHAKNAKQTIRGAKDWLGSTDGTLFLKAAVGRPRTDGLQNNQVTSGKVRAFGLRESFQIVPKWIGETGEKGIVLESKI
jgi:RecA-family ATPase